MGEAGKPVSRVELYLDLVLVVAISQLSRLIVDTPQLKTVWIAYALFVPVWWTWVDFAVLYNRHGDDNRVQRALFLAISAPVAVAAVATGPASHGHVVAFAVSLAATRLMLAAAHLHDPDPTSSAGDALRRRTAAVSVLAAALFVASIWVPSPFRYAIWVTSVLCESQVLFSGDRKSAKTARREHDLTALAPRDPAEALDSDHFAERFGLFMIILLGEVVAQAGESAAALDTQTISSWASLVAAVTLAGALWWVYFDAVAELDRRVLELSGGSPAMARTVFAVGHMVPAFALLMVSAGVGLLAHADPPRIAYWLTSVGAGVYLAGTHSLLRASGKAARVIRTLVTIGTFLLAALHNVISPLSYLCLVAAWTAGAAALASRTAPHPALKQPEEAEAPAAAAPAVAAPDAEAASQPE
jgi:low temperature requirement protein LtrA